MHLEKHPEAVCSFAAGAACAAEEAATTKTGPSREREHCHCNMEGPMLSDCKQHLAPRSGFALAQDAGTRAALKSDGGCSLLWLQPATRKSPCASPLRALARARIETRSHHESLGRPSYTTLSPLRSPLCAGISPADGWQTSTTNDGLWRNLLTRAWHMGRLRLLAVDELGTKPAPKAPCCMCR